MNAQESAQHFINHLPYSDYLPTTLPALNTSLSLSCTHELHALHAHISIDFGRIFSNVTLNCTDTIFLCLILESGFSSTFPHYHTASERLSYIMVDAPYYNSLFLIP